MNTIEVAQTTYTIGESSTGLIHRAYTHRGYGTAHCSTGGNIRSIIVRNLKNITVGEVPTGKLCTKCF